jgi:DUF4097 and DUF4098 domain-containing protein YvlB
MTTIVPQRGPARGVWIASLLLLFAAVDARAQVRGRRDYDRDYRSSIDTSFAFDRRGTVILTIGSGDIIVTAWSRDQIRIHASSESQNIRLDATSSRVTLELTDSYRHRGDTRFEVSVPTGARVIARAQSGDITISGTKGEIEARTQSGDVAVEDAGDRLDLVTLSGDIRAQGLTGDVQIKTVNGDVRVTDLKGDFEAESVSGSIEVRNAEGRYVRCHTTSGDLAYDGTIDPSGRYELVTHSGDVRLAIPSTAGAQLSISTWSGAIESDFPITLKPGEHGIGSGQAKRFTFEIGNGAARINAESFSGDITISSKGSPRR